MGETDAVVPTPPPRWPALSPSAPSATGVEPARPDAPAPPTPRTLASAIFGWLLVALCVGSLGWGWATGIHPATDAQLDRDRQAGVIDHWFVTDRISEGSRYEFARAEDARWSDLMDPGREGGLVVWQVGSRWFVAEPGRTISGVQSGLNALSTPDSEAAVARLRESVGEQSIPWVRWDLQGIALTVMVGAWFLNLVFGSSAPSRGSRWFWFWVGLMPLGLGVAAYAVGERIRPRQTAGRRSSGWAGLAVLILGGIAVSAALQGLAQLGLSVPIG